MWLNWPYDSRLYAVLTRKVSCHGQIQQQRKFSSYEIFLIQITHQGESLNILSAILSHHCLARTTAALKGIIKNMSLWVKTIILPLVLYGCETWSLTLREEHVLRVYENRVLRRIFEWKTAEVAGEWRKLHNEELRDVYCSPSIIRIIKSRRMGWAGHGARMGRRGMRIAWA
jgi:hypothetical protein